MQSDRPTTTRDLIDLCSPRESLAGASQAQEGLSSLTMLGTAFIGTDSLRISCLLEYLRDTAGNYKGEKVFPINTELLQRDHRLQANVRTIELRAAITQNGNRRLVYRKCGKPGMTNSWTDSAEECLLEASGRWGWFSSNHELARYQFHPCAGSEDAEEKLPSITELFSRYLADDVISSADHPYLTRNFGQPTSSGSSALDRAASQMMEDDSDDLY